jgi:hypothetical protein
MGNKDWMFKHKQGTLSNYQDESGYLGVDLGLVNQIRSD